jgi:membrane protease YdiL (CAAX protease family)
LAIAGAYLLAECGLWTAGAVQRGFIIAAMCWIAGCTLLQRRSAKELGLGLRGLRQSSWLLLAALALAAILMAVLRGEGSQFALQRPIQLWRVWGYSFWALEQEFILNSFLFLNLERLAGARRAVVLSAVVFAIAHIPNPLLTVLTLLAGLVFCAVFARHRNIWPLAAAHALLGIAVAVSAPDRVTHHMRVGLGYHSWTPITLSVHPGASSPQANRARAQ